MKSSNRGSISVFIIFILISVILFEFVLLDVGQSMMLNHQLDQLSESSLRSIHAEYDKSLSEYGLYGINNIDEKKNKLIKQMKSNNINNSNKIFSSIIDIKIEKFSSTSFLNDINVLQSQILNEMKWRAPLEWSFVAIDKLKQSNPSEAIEKSVKIAEFSKEFEKKLDNYYKTYIELDNLVNELFGNNGLIDSYCESSKISLGKLEKETNYAAFITLWNIYVLEMKLKQPQFNLQIEKFMSKLDTLKNLHEELQKELVNIEFSTYPQQLLISESYFNKIKLSTKEIQSLISGMSSLINSIDHLVGSDFTNRKQELLNSIGEVLQAIGLIFAYHNSEFTIINNGVNDRLASQKESKNLISRNISELKSVLHSCQNIDNQFEFTGNLMNSNEIGMEALKKTESIFKSIEVFTNHLYVSEFALNKFNYRTFNGSKEKSFNQTHKLYNYELEKVIYGYNSCEESQSLASSEIFLTRLAIRVAEELMNGTYKVAVSPWTAFIEIVAKSSYLALEDTKKLVRGEAVQFWVNTKSIIKLNYLDYLRFYLYVQKNTKDTLLSIQKLIELNTRVQFHNVSTATHLVVSMKRTQQSIISAWGTNNGVAEAKFSY